MLQRFVVLALCFTVLAACSPDAGKSGVRASSSLTSSEGKVLEAWWSFFNDPVLDKFVSSAISLNSNYATEKKAHIEQLDMLEAMRRQYNSPRAGLVLEVVHSYIRYRYIQNQKGLLGQYLDERDEVYANFVRKAKDKDLDDPRAVKMKSDIEALFKQKTAFQRKEIELQRKLTKLTMLLPEYVSQILREPGQIPHSDITPVLASPASVVASSVNVLAVRALFAQQSGSGKASLSKTALIFPNMTLNSFYGVSDDVFLNNETPWNVTLGQAVRNLDMKNYERSFANKPIYVTFKNNLYKAIEDIERLIVSYAHIQEQYLVLRKVAENEESKPQYTKPRGRTQDVSAYMKLIEEHDNLYKTQLAVLRAEYEQVKILVDLYGALGAY